MTDSEAVRMILRRAVRQRALTRKQEKRLLGMLEGQFEPALSDLQLIEWVNMVNVPPELTAEVYRAQ
jgi:hypothetical protein